MNPWGTVTAATRQGWQHHRRALETPAATQADLLGEILRANRGCALGRHLGLAGIEDVEDYRTRVPLHRDEDLRPWLDATCDGEAQQCVSAPALLFERTSGSTGAARRLPYTAAALAGFRNALDPWLHDLLRRWPGIAGGRVYFALSPAVLRRGRPGPIPEGSGDDAVYLGPHLAPALAELSVVDPRIAGVDDLKAWRAQTLHALAGARDLSLVSVWSPTFLSRLLDALPACAEGIAGDLERGRRPDLRGGHVPATPRPARAEEVRAALCNGAPDFRLLWPDLQLVSCWSDATASRYLPALQGRLPGVSFQGKGLLATEGAVSIPFGEDPVPVLALRAAFFEFVDEASHPPGWPGPRARTRLAHELEDGATYGVVLTTHAGLYRFWLGDRVRVEGSAARTPRVRFLGRSGGISDLCGEKLSELQVQAALVGTRGFALLLADAGPVPGYRLVLDDREHDEASAQRAARALDRALRDNPYYDQARRLEQLGPIRPGRHRDPMGRYLAWARRRGQRLGDIKPPVLYGHQDLAAVFDEERLPCTSH